MFFLLFGPICFNAVIVNLSDFSFFCRSSEGGSSYRRWHTLLRRRWCGRPELYGGQVTASCRTSLVHKRQRSELTIEFVIYFYLFEKKINMFTFLCLHCFLVHCIFMPHKISAKLQKKNCRKYFSQDFQLFPNDN